MTLRLAALVALFTAAVCSISWPGFMSFDSMYALRQARTGIESGVYPPMVSYLWWLCERILPGQGCMFLVGNALAFAGVSSLGRALGVGELRILLAMLMLAVAPLTLGPMLVVWKDVTFGGLMAIAYAITLHSIERKRRATMTAAVVSLAVASSFRLNGIFAAAPALAVVAWTICSEARSDQSRIARIALARGPTRWLKSTLLFLILAATTFAFVVASASWRLPDLKRIGMPMGNVGVQLHDLLGISVCTGSNLLPPNIHSGEMTLDRLGHLYYPEHAGRSFGPPPLLDQAVVEANEQQIASSAVAARIAHPWCYLEHRARVFLYGVGANAGPVFYLVQPGVFPGEPFTDVVPTDRTASTLDYIMEHESSIFARSYIYALLAVVALAVAHHEPYSRRRSKALLPMAGAVAYMAGSFFVMPAADARYNFWPNLVFMTTFCCVLPLPRVRASFRTR